MTQEKKPLVPLKIAEQGVFVDLQLDHAVADAHMRLNELRRIGPGLQLFAQGRHEYAQGGNVAVKGRAPDFARQIGVREHLARVAAQQARCSRTPI